MYELLVSAPPAQPAAADGAQPAGGAAAGGGAAQQGGAAAGAKDAWSDMFRSMGAKGAADRGGMSMPN